MGKGLLHDLEGLSKWPPRPLLTQRFCESMKCLDEGEQTQPFKSKIPVSIFQLSHLLAVWLLASDLTSLSPDFSSENLGQCQILSRCQEDEIIKYFSDMGQGARQRVGAKVLLVLIHTRFWLGQKCRSYLNFKRLCKIYLITTLNDSCMLSSHSLLLMTYTCRVHHVKCQAGWITSWNQDCQEKYQQPKICRWYHFNGRK